MDLKNEIRILLLIISITVAMSCLCMPSHPQDALCYNNTYVALLKVRSEELVYSEDLPMTTTSPSTDEDRLNQMKNNILSDVDRQSIKKQLSFRPRPSRRDVIVNNRADLPYDHYISSKIRYRVKIYEAYQGIDETKLQGKNLYVYTAPEESLCGVTLHEKKTYIVTGRVDDGRLTIGLCDHVIKWDDIDVRQKRVVRRNMRDASSACKAKCRVNMCGWSDCQRRHKANVCLWSNEMEENARKNDLDRANFMCVPAGKNSCTWSNTVVDRRRRRRRRRRHHEFLTKRVDLAKNSGLFP